MLIADLSRFQPLQARARWAQLLRCLSQSLSATIAIARAERAAAGGAGASAPGGLVLDVPSAHVLLLCVR